MPQLGQFYNSRIAMGMGTRIPPETGAIETNPPNKGVAAVMMPSTFPVPHLPHSHYRRFTQRTSDWLQLDKEALGCQLFGTDGDGEGFINK